MKGSYLIRTILAALAAATMGGSATAGGKPKLEGDDALRWEAAQALYGEGLEIKRAKGKVTIAPKRDGLTQEKYDQYVEKVYLPLAKITTQNQGRLVRFADNYDDPKFATRADPKLAHLLLEPYFKYRLCREIAIAVGDKPGPSSKYEHINWCALQGIIEATSPIFEYRGEAVTWDDSRERGDLAIDAPIWVKNDLGHYPIVVTVAGYREALTPRGITALGEMWGDVQDFADGYAPVEKVKEARIAAWHKLLDAAEKQQKKLAGKKKVVFAEVPFQDHLAIPMAKGPIDCQKSYYWTWAPEKQRDDGYAVAIFVDGVECSWFAADPGEVDRNHIWTLEPCRNLMKPGTHKLTVSVHESHTTGHYSRTEVTHDDRVVKRQYDETVTGKKLHGDSIECVAP